MIIRFVSGAFEAHQLLASDRKTVGRAGFRFDEDSRIWFTENPGIAGRLRKYADPSARKEINRVMIKRSPWFAPLPYPKDLSPRPYQYAAALFALEQNKSYLALEPGLGKTIVAALVRNALNCPTVYFSPPGLTRNIEAEFKKWSTGSPAIERFDLHDPKIWRGDILIMPDNVLDRPEARHEILDLIETARQRGQKTLAFVDEAQRFKTPGAERTGLLLGDDLTRPDGLIRLFDHYSYLSGTPMENRPMELYPILTTSFPESIDFMSASEYGERFCGPKWNGYAVEYKGASNMPELRERVRESFMLRLRKKDVLKDLPPKLEEIIIIGDAPARVIGMERKILAKHSIEDLMAEKVSSPHTSTYLRELGSFKVKPALELIRSILDENEDEALVVFAYHKDVIASLFSGLKKYSPVLIDGKTKDAKKHEAVKTFQSDPKRRLLVANYLSGGIGHTMTKASRALMVEFSWVPGKNEQAGDRLHRFGQTEPVLIQYLVYQGSIDQDVMEVCFRKKKIVNYI